MLNNGTNRVNTFSCLFRIKKSYHCSKIHESKATQSAAIRYAINKRIENFCLDKGHMIKSILDKPFCKVVFNYLIVDDKLVLDPDEIKSKVDVIMEKRTKKHSVSGFLLDLWACQYALLHYVNNSAFFCIMDVISFSELSQIVKYLSNEKAAGLSSIPNKL
ncbi:hypothetical protein G9A89_022846 [Geosiphon pyriformis]|nr:hypothetical protein G9A89_022846 [Geosiphon pyriformis]